MVLPVKMTKVLCYARLLGHWRIAHRSVTTFEYINWTQNAISNTSIQTTSTSKPFNNSYHSSTSSSSIANHIPLNYKNFPLEPHSHYQHGRYQNRLRCLVRGPPLRRVRCTWLVLAYTKYVSQILPLHRILLFAGFF